jgi:hypothetical protein
MSRLRQDGVANPTHHEMVKRCLRRALFGSGTRNFLQNANERLNAGHTLSRKQIAWLEDRYFDYLVPYEEDLATDPAAAERHTRPLYRRHRRKHAAAWAAFMEEEKAKAGGNGAGVPSEQQEAAND